MSPVLLGQDHLQGLVGMQRPLLFVGNHQKLGLYDVSLLLTGAEGCWLAIGMVWHVFLAAFTES